MTSLFSSFDLMFYLLKFATHYFLLTSLMISIYPLSKKSLVTNWFFSKIELIYSSTCSLNNKGKMKLVCLIFMCVFFMNLFSIFSFIFPLTSQLSVVLMIGLGMWMSVIMFSILNNWNKVISHLTPLSCPMALSMALVMVETISMMIRPLTLTVRLMANILAGHLMMILISEMALKISWTFLLLVIMNTFEIFVSLIQAYIFTTMITLYVSEI